MQSIFTIIPRVVVPQGNAEMVGIAQAVAAQSHLDWTVFRVPFLNDGPADTPVSAGLRGAADYKGSMQLARASLARWLLQEIKDRAWVQQAPVLGNY